MHWYTTSHITQFYSCQESSCSKLVENGRSAQPGGNEWLEILFSKRVARVFIQLKVLTLCPLIYGLTILKCCRKLIQSNQRHTDIHKNDCVLQHLKPPIFTLLISETNSDPLLRSNQNKITSYSFTE